MEEKLVADLKSQDPLRFEKLYKRYCNPVYGILYRIVRNDQDAQKLLERVFITIWRSAQSYKAENGTLLFWMLGIAAREAVDFLHGRPAAPES